MWHNLSWPSISLPSCRMAKGEEMRHFLSNLPMGENWSTLLVRLYPYLQNDDVFNWNWLDLSPVTTSEVTQSSANMSTQSRRGRLKRQDTPINVDNREKVTRSHFMKKCLSRRSLSSPSSQRTSSCDEKQHSPKCPGSLTDQQTKGIKSAVCPVNSNPSSSASSAPR